MAQAERQILVVTHTGRQEALRAAAEVCERLRDAGVIVVVPAGQRDELGEVHPGLDSLETFGEGDAEHELELAIVLGGDGTILRAAELVRAAGTPLLGVNLGHVGFLAEIERDDLSAAVERALARDYNVEERMTLAVSVRQGTEVIFETWALNEASVEKASRERMLEVAIEIDERPLSTFGCDGVLMATPTGSTAYSFSAGGPVVWPDLDAMLLVPLSAHALFARPLVVSPDSSLAVELLERTATPGVLWCDGRRSFDLPIGARVITRRSDTPVRLARLHPRPFTERLMRKFDLPVTGWRGPRP